MKVHDNIEQKVRDALAPTHVEVINESHMHSGPRTDSHFKLVVVSDAFNGLGKVKRHQTVYRLLETELKEGVHALALHLFTLEEWSRVTVPDSPLCASKKNQN